MPYKGILHAQRSAEVAVTACDLGQAIFKFPESISARAATSHTTTFYERSGILSIQELQTRADMYCGTGSSQVYGAERQFFTGGSLPFAERPKRQTSDAVSLS
eukprot:6190971-Pleurochrysis_carterae.AAC.1